MSIESAKAFIERMKSDQEFAKKVHELKSKEEAMRFVASQGFSFTGEEYALAQPEVSDHELDSVTGGTHVWVCALLRRPF